MNCEATTTTTVKLTAAELYEQENLMYIRFKAPIVEKGNGQKNIGGTRPPFKDLTEQPKYERGIGKFYYLLMGREYKPGRFIILLDFDNKVEGEIQNGMDLVEKLDMDQYNAPKQTTPSGGLRYLLYANAEQAKRLPSSRTGITHEGVKYNMDVKFTNQLCNCAPSKIEGYGAYKWTNPSKLRLIPPLPLELFNVIKEKQKRASPTRTISSRTRQVCKSAPTARSGLMAVSSCAGRARPSAHSLGWWSIPTKFPISGCRTLATTRNFMILRTSRCSKVRRARCSGAAPRAARSF